MGNGAKLFRKTSTTIYPEWNQLRQIFKLDDSSSSRPGLADTLATLRDQLSILLYRRESSRQLIQIDRSDLHDNTSSFVGPSNRPGSSLTTSLVALLQQARFSAWRTGDGMEYKLSSFERFWSDPSQNCSRLVGC